MSITGDVSATIGFNQHAISLFQRRVTPKQNQYINGAINLQYTCTDDVSISLNITRYVFLYSAVSSPLDRSKRFTLFSSPGRPVHSDTNSAYLGSILAMQQLRNDYTLTCPPLSIARYSFIQLSRLRRRGVNENAQISKR